EKRQAWEGEKEHWETFASDMKNWYDTDFSCVREDFIKEQRKYYLQTGAFVNLTPKHLAGPARPLFEMDLLTLSLEELKNPSKPLRCAMKVAKDGPIEGFTGYFDAFFRGSAEMPVEQEVTLTTAPTSATATHWGQQLFGFYPPLSAKRGDTLECEMFIRGVRGVYQEGGATLAAAVAAESSHVDLRERRGLYQHAVLRLMPWRLPPLPPVRLQAQDPAGALALAAAAAAALAARLTLRRLRRRFAAALGGDCAAAAGAQAAAGAAAPPAASAGARQKRPREAEATGGRGQGSPEARKLGVSKAYQEGWGLNASRPCRFAAMGCCKWGESCYYSHAPADLAVAGRKAEVCSFWALGVTCRFVPYCQNAHGEDELQERTPPMPPPSWGDGSGLLYADSHCHLDGVLLSRRLGQRWMFKTKLCKEWAMFGRACYFDANCHYAHGEGEILQRPPLERRDFVKFVSELPSGFVGLVQNCVDPESIEQTVELVQWGRELLDGRVYATFGLHPTEHYRYSDELDLAEALGRVPPLRRPCGRLGRVRHGLCQRGSRLQLGLITTPPS
ncbi:unnamed protein product, partial [Prorocentrum cordatum]